jgi:hypothetical protein
MRWLLEVGASIRVDLDNLGRTSYRLVAQRSTLVGSWRSGEVEVRCKKFTAICGSSSADIVYAPSVLRPSVIDFFLVQLVSD